MHSVILETSKDYNPSDYKQGRHCLVGLPSSVGRTIMLSDRPAEPLFYYVVLLNDLANHMAKNQKYFCRGILH